ncbi:MAG: hypothetical protein WBD87_09470 [Candidatus Acidiferrales bacterium]
MPALQSALDSPSSLALYQNRYLFVVENLVKVRVIDLQQGTITTVAGNGKDCCYKEGALGTQVSLDLITSIAVDQYGNLFIADDGDIRKVDAMTRQISTIDANSEVGAWGLASDPQGNLFLSSGVQILRVDYGSDAISTIAGNGKSGFSGDGGPALDASLLDPLSLALDPAGDIFVADVENCRLRRIDHFSGAINTIAQSGGIAENCPPQQGGSMWQQSLDDPVVDAKGNVFFDEPSADFVARAGSIPDRPIIVAGTGDRGFSGDGGPATSATFDSPSGLAVDSGGNLFISDFGNNRIRRIDAKTQIITTIAGNGLPHRVRVEM